MRKIFAKPQWYAAGLAFECADCGQCCAGPEEGYVWVTPAEIAAIAGELGIGETEMRRKHVRKVGRRFSLVERKDNNDCIFLTGQADGTRKCLIYSVRPTQCRTWPFWPGNLASSEDWALAHMRCEGINRGRQFDCDEIEQRRRATRS